MDAHNKCVNAQLQIPRDNEVLRGRVVKLPKDSNDNPVGVSSETPYLDAREYEVEFEDETHKNGTQPTLLQRMGMLSARIKERCS